ncbi:MAG TPA: condensation domain-containing protein, partial [Cytophagales bacterium]
MSNRNIHSLFERLRQAGIKLELNENGNLDVKAPKGALSAGFIDEIKHGKTEIIASLAATQAAPASGRISPAPAAESYPLSSSQMRLWVSQQVNPNSTAYCIPKVAALKSDFDFHAYERAIRALVERHEILRTAFRQQADGTARQWVLPTESLDLNLQYHDLREGASGEEEARQLIREDIRRPFNLEKAPLFRIMVFRLAEASYLLYYNVHHIITDGWSMNVLINDLQAAYEADRRGERPAWAPLTIQYKDYAVWQQEQLQSNQLRVHRDYWLAQLGGELPVLDLVPGQARPAATGPNGYCLSMRIDETLTAGLRDLCRRQQTTLFMGLLAGLNALLYRYSGQQDIVINSPVAGREYAELGNQIGFYVNTLPLRTRFAGTDSFVDLLQHVRTVTLSAYAHLMYPFDELVEEVSPGRGAGRSALSDVMFTLHSQLPSQSFARSGAGATAVQAVTDEGETVAKLDLSFEVAEIGGELLLRVEYNQDLYSRSFVEGLLEHYRYLLAAAVAQPELPLRRLDYLSEPHKQVLLGLAQGPQQELGECLPQLLEAAFQRHGQKPAVLFGEQAFSFAQLEAFSARLAHWLVEHHQVGAGHWVGVQLERSHWLVGVLAGIVRCGAAYLPLEVSYPAQRLQLMLADSGCRLVIDEAMLAQALAQLEEYSPFWLSPEPAPCQAAYMIYTSGSSGQPKGVVITHQNLSNYLSYCWQAYVSAAREPVRMALFTSLSFDLTVTSLWAGLVSGAPLVVLPQQAPIEELLEEAFFGEQALTLLKCTPAHVSLLKEISAKEISAKEISAKEISAKEISAKEIS